ncbi:MAG: methylaspartate mutase subunit S [Deltaproteobacteria bacterium]|nr:methylaspartate mutase subunit S [Deltaproteobacteria bacterium]
MENQKTLIIGVIGVDAHVVGNKLMENVLRQAGFKVVNLGTFVTQQDFLKAAIETNADAILVASMCGHGELECQGFREACTEAGRGDIHLIVGGNLVVGKQDFAGVDERFQKMGFDKVYPPGVSPYRVIEDLKKELGVSNP